MSAVCLQLLATPPQIPTTLAYILRDQLKRTKKQFSQVFPSIKTCLKQALTNFLNKPENNVRNKQVKNRTEKVQLIMRSDLEGVRIRRGGPYRNKKKNCAL